MAAHETQRLLPVQQQQHDVEKKPQQPPKSIILSVCSYILAAEFCLCLSSATLTGSLPIYFRKHLGLDSFHATVLSNLLTCLFNLTPIIGAYVADTHLGRYNTIAIACGAYIVGLALCTAASTATLSSFPLFIFGLYFCITLAAGGIKPNVVVLGADQFDLDIPAQRIEKESFFNWFYWSINIGSFLSYSVLANISVNGLPPYIPEDQGFMASFCFATIAFMVGAAVFLSGKSRYRRLPPKGSVLTSFFQILGQAGRKSAQGKLVLSGGIAFVPGIVLTTISYFVDEPQWHMALALSGAAAVVYGTIVLMFAARSTHWVRRASIHNGGSFSAAQVKDASQVVRLMPYMSIIILFWASYSQMSSNFQLQGCQMDLRLSSSPGSTLISPATLTILNSGAILIFIPIFDRVIYPFMTAIGLYPTLLRKMGSGLFFSLLSMLVAGYIEVERKQRGFVEGGVFSNCASSSEALPMSQMSIWWQALQYLLVGISEILTSITAYDLFYSEVPESMRSACQALNLLAITLGYIVAGALNSIFSFWVTTDLNQGHIENIFFVVAVLLLVNLMAFVFVSRSFKYHVPPPDTSASISGFSPAIARAARAVMGAYLLDVVKMKSKRLENGYIGVLDGVAGSFRGGDFGWSHLGFRTAMGADSKRQHTDERTQLLLPVSPPPPPLIQLQHLDLVDGSIRTSDPLCGQRGTNALNTTDTASKSVLLHACLPILALQFSLWVASATLTGSVPIYVKKHLGIDSVRATEISYALQTLTNLTPLVGGYLADQHLGRFNTIVLACITFTIGMVLCTIAAHPAVASVELLLIGLFGFVAIAQGGTAPCIVVLGADQFDLDIPAQRLEKQSFFNWFYWAINIGSFLSFLFLSNLAVNGVSPLVSPQLGFFAAFGIATLVFATGACVFYKGKPRYRRLPPKGSVLTKFVAVLWRVCMQTTRGRLVLSGGAAFAPGILLTIASFCVHESSSWHVVLALGGAGSVVYGVTVLIVCCRSVDWVQHTSQTVHDDVSSQLLVMPDREDAVRDVAQVLRILPYMGAIIIFWATYSQMETNFLLQGCQMDLRVASRNGGMVSSAMLTMLDSSVILLGIPVFDRLVYPTLTKWGLFPTLLRKIGAGLVFAMAAMLCAAGLEVQRKHSALVVGVGSNCATSQLSDNQDDDVAQSLPMSAVSVWWQTLQYVLIGISEILTSITSYDLFYSEVPASMRSACQSLNVLTTTLGYIVAGTLNSIFSVWVTSDLNHGNLEGIFLIMAALIALSLTAFVYASQSFEYTTDCELPPPKVTESTA